ncbi:MAG: hypothetical protein IKZ34_02480 [Alphaproteobacteria bacterium]|jgi:hypothetical protein|nr:hypothetical protein [Alphaproteobacteria bacterium]
MRILVFGFLALFCITGVVQAAVPNVPTVSYVNNADNLTKGTVNVQRLPVGEVADTVAAGNDKRFDTVPLGRPDVTVSEGRALMWIE